MGRPDASIFSCPSPSFRRPDSRSAWLFFLFFTVRPDKSDELDEPDKPYGSARFFFGPFRWALVLFSRLIFSEEAFWFSSFLSPCSLAFFFFSS